MKWKINNQHIFSIVLLLFLSLGVSTPYTYAQCIGATASVTQGTDVSATTTGNTTTAGYVTEYVLADQAGQIIAVNTTGIFSTTGLTPGTTYQIHVLNYDSGAQPTAIPLANGDAISDVNDGCFNADFTTEALCFTIQASACIASMDVAQGTDISTTTTGQNTSTGYMTLYVLADQSGVIIATNTSGTFPTGGLTTGTTYQIHIINYDSGSSPTTLPIVNGNISDTNDGCFNADFATEYLCVTIINGDCLASQTICEGDPLMVTTTGDNMSANYSTVYVLVDPANNQVLASNMTGDFTNDVVGGNNYQIHILNYDTTDPPDPLPINPGDDITTIGSTTMGCYDTDFLTEYLCVTVNVLPTIASATPACTGGDGTGTITVNASTTSGNALEYSIGGPFQASNMFSNLANNTYTVTVRDAVTLCSATTMVAVNCNQNCPTVTQVDDSDIVCVNGTTELAAWQMAVMNANTGVTGATGPSYSSVPVTANNFPQPVDNATYDGDNCSTETENYYAYYTCDADGSFLPAGEYILTIYPDISQQNNVVQNAGSCCPTVQLQCTSGYSVTSDVMNCTSQTNSGAINFTVSLNNPPAGLDATCTSLIIPSNYDCRTCPTANNASGSFNFCINDLDVDLSLNGESGVGVSSDPSGAFAGLEWYAQGNIPGTDPVYTEGSTMVNDNCNTASTVVEAYLLCDLNGDGFNNGPDDSYVAAGSITVTVYPDISQQNNVVIDDGGCCPTLQLECPTGYSYTNTLDNTTGDPDCTNQQGEGAFNFIVQLDNPPMGLDATPCLSNTIIATYRCCIAEAGVVEHDPACPETDFIVRVIGQTTEVDYGTWLIITDGNGDIVAAIDFAGASSLAIPYSAWANYLGYGMNYTFYSYNYQLDDPPTPDPNAAANLADIGNIDNGCFDLSDVGVIEYIPQEIGTADQNTSEGDEGSVTPFHYNEHDITFVGGTPPYTFEWDRTGYVRRDIRFYNDGYDHEVDDLDMPEDPGVPNINPGGIIEIVYNDYATWHVTITDANGCSHPSWQMTNDPDNPDDASQILDIYDQIITGATNPATENGAIDISVEGGCPPYTYQWGGPHGFSATTEDLTDLHYGWYFVSVTDAGGTACPDEIQQTTMGWYWVPKNLGNVSSGFIRGKTAATAGTQLLAYPNPLETMTTVAFTTTEATQATVNLYSVDGKKVKEVFSGATEAQQLYNITLDAGQLANGVYILQLTTSTGEQQQQKLLIAQ